jgi:23S rRNA (uracil1939-C5)-methyltransferase
MARRKKKAQNITVTGIADKGKAVGRDPEGMVYFVDGAVPGDVVDVLVLRKKKSFRQAVVTDYISLSSDRIDPVCEHFGECGGCKWQHLDYKAQLRHKQQTVVDAMTKIAKLSADKVEPIMGSAKTYQYRNKLEYSFSHKRWITQAQVDSGKPVDQYPAVGFHRPGAWDKIVDVYTCHLQDDLSNQLRNSIREYSKEHGLTFYNQRDHKGLLRNMIVRNTSIGEWMLIVAFGEDQPDEIEGLMSYLQTTFPQITSLQYVVNTKKNDTLYDQDIKLYNGKAYIIEQLRDVQYKVGPKSFFQTNSEQAVTLYDVVVDFAELQPTDNVYDLYTGLGSIALYVAHQCAHVTGIEEVAPAIEDARENMALNDITNATFYAGDVKDILDVDFIAKHGKPDVVITDPPRAGMHGDVIATLLSLQSPRIVYVSCNPGTQARDLLLLSEKYDVLRLQPVDMFPHTHHIENVALLELRKDLSNE